MTAGKRFWELPSSSPPPAPDSLKGAVICRSEGVRSEEAVRDFADRADAHDFALHASVHGCDARGCRRDHTLVWVDRGRYRVRTIGPSDDECLCRPCVAKAQAEADAEAYRRERQRRYNEHYYAKNGAAIRERVRRWYADHKEHRAEYHRRWREANREKLKADKAAYAEKNPDGERERQRRYRQRRKARQAALSPSGHAAATAAPTAVAGNPTRENGSQRPTDNIAHHPHGKSEGTHND